VTRTERLDAVLVALASGPLCVSQIAKMTERPLTSTWNVVQDLILAGKVRFIGYTLNDLVKGGSPVKMYALATAGPHGKPLIYYARKEKNAKRVEWKPAKPRHFAGSGVVAGRIVIGRGSKWGAGLA